MEGQEVTPITILQGDCREVLKPLPDESVQCCVTSPPYWGLRDYGHADQIGQEATPEEYVESLRIVFDEVWRALRDDGTLWLNLGDTYARNDKKGGSGFGGKNQKYLGDNYERARVNVPPNLKPKDLIGIPWRVALALQQPREHTAIKNIIDRAWLAGLTDGEGCLSILDCKSPHGSGNSYPPILQIRMCDPECIDRAKFITGYVESSILQHPPSQGGVRGSYQWRLHGEKAAQITAEIFPYLLIKRKQAVILWNHQRVRDSYETKRGVKIPADALEKQKECRRLIQILNQKASADIPSWMDEPKITVTPGWYLRSDVIWHKPNPMPESVTDRPTRSHEYIFLLTKSERYYFDNEAIKEPASDAMLMEVNQGYDGLGLKDYAAAGVQNPSGVKARIITNARKRADQFRGNKHNGETTKHSDGSVYTGKITVNKRTVWTVPTAPFNGAHFATFPPDLIKPCILAGTKPGDVVLDPFGGSGTTGMVALELGRRAILIELNESYTQLCWERCNITQGLHL